MACDLSKPAKFFAFYIAGTIRSLFPIFTSASREVCSAGAEERAIMIGSSNSVGLSH